MAIKKKCVFNSLNFNQVVGAEQDDEWYGDKQVGTDETTGQLATHHIMLTSDYSYLGANCLQVMLEQGVWRDDGVGKLARAELRCQVLGGHPGVMSGWVSFAFATKSIGLGDGTAVIKQLWDGGSPSVSIRYRYNTGEVFLRRYQDSVGSTDHHLFYASVDGSGNPVWNTLDIWYSSTESSTDRIKIWVNGVCDPGNDIGVDYTGQIIFNAEKTGSKPYWKIGAYDSSFGEEPTAAESITLYFDAVVYCDNTDSEADTLVQINAFRNSVASHDVTIITGQNGSALGEGTYSEGETAELQAVPNSGYQFVEWQENGSFLSSDNPLSITVNDDREITAIFEPIPVTTHTITLISAGNGSVSGGGTFEGGATVSATATPDPGYVFDRWEGATQKYISNPYQFQAEEDRTLTAFFVEEESPTETISHPIVLNQLYICPSNAENGDNVGKVNFLWSHRRFYNRQFGANLSESSYSFSIQNSDGTFAIDSSTGELTVLDASQFTENKTVEVRVSVGPFYYNDIECTVVYLDEQNCIFIDPDFTGTSDGSRSAPYPKYRNSGVSVSPGQAILIKRGTTFDNDWIRLVSPKVNGNYPDWLYVGAYGQGARPIIDGHNNIELSTNHRFISVGAPMNDDGSQPQFAANKVKVFDLETTLSNPHTNAWYPFEVKVLGDYIEFHRIKCSKVGLWENGFFWLTAKIATPVVDRKMVFKDIELYDHSYRGFKIETSGVSCYNFKCYNNWSPGGFPVSFATLPIGELSFLDAFVADHGDGGLGIQIRADHVYRYCHIDGAQNALVSFGLTDAFERNGRFENIIVKNAKVRASLFHKNPGVTKNSDGLVFRNIDLVDCASGLDIGNGALNTKVIYVSATGTSGTGIKVHASADGVDIHNVTAVDNSTDISIDAPNVEIKNSIYGTLSGTASPTLENNSQNLSDFVDRPGGNYRIIPGSSLIGAGQDLGYKTDIEGKPIPVLPTLGAYEFEAAVTYTITIGTDVGGYAYEVSEGPYRQGDQVQLVAVEETGALKHWELELSPGTTGIVGTGSLTYSFIMPSNDVTITPVFEPIPVVGGLVFQGQFLLE